MDTEQTASQLRLAADILETGHPWEYSTDHFHWKLSTGKCPMFAIRSQWEIRLALATPPDNRPLHNPDNLTAEQVGAGWRLTVEGEWNPKQEYWHSTGKWTGSTHYSELDTFRLPLSTPWPDPKPDPYAALKQAHKEGKVIQVQVTPLVWEDRPEPSWSESPDCYRIKPSTPHFQLPPPPPGMPWHREDGWKAEMLPQGYRPLVIGEELQPGDEGNYNDGFMRFSGGNRVMYSQYYYRTTRPLTFTHEGKPWTYHRPGDPMPCDANRRVEWMLKKEASGEWPFMKSVELASDIDWVDIIGWRYADEPKTQVPLGPEDVPPGSVIQLRDRPDSDALAVGFHDVICVCRTHVIAFNEYGNKITIEWGPLKDWQINRSIPLTGKWNPDAWEPCHKLG